MNIFEMRVMRLVFEKKIQTMFILEKNFFSKIWFFS